MSQHKETVLKNNPILRNMLPEKKEEVTWESSPLPAKMRKSKYLEEGSKEAVLQNNQILMEMNQERIEEAKEVKPIKVRFYKKTFYTVFHNWCLRFLLHNDIHPKTEPIMGFLPDHVVGYYCWEGITFYFNTSDRILCFKENTALPTAADWVSFEEVGL